MLVPRSRYEEIVEKVKEIAEAVTVGDPQSDVQIGPLVSSTKRDRVRSYIEKGVAEGARLVTGGAEAPEGLSTGYYVRPTVFADVDNSMTIAQEEIFGPVLTVIPYEDDDDAVRIANDTIYGLSGAVWSADPSGPSGWLAGCVPGSCGSTGGRVAAPPSAGSSSRVSVASRAGSASRSTSSSRRSASLAHRPILAVRPTRSGPPRPSTATDARRRR